MPIQHPNIIRFNGGQWSEKLRARVDLEDYDASLEEMKGFIPLKYGEAQAMTGFLHGEQTKYPDKKSIFIPFQYSASDSFWLEFGDLYMRVVDPSTGLYVVKSSADGWLTSTGYVIGDFVTNSSVIYYCLEAHTSGTFATDLADEKWVAQTAFEIPTPYVEAELYDIQYQNLNDLIILTHGSHMPSEVIRVANDNWTITDYAQDWPAFLSENLERDWYVAPSAVSGSVTLSATGTGNEPFIGGSDLIGSYFAITQRRGAQSVTRDIDNAFTPPEIKVKGPWTFKSFFENPSDAGTDTIYLDRSDDDGSTWVRVFEAEMFSGHNGFDVSGDVLEDDVIFKFGITGTSAGSTGYLNITFTTEDTEVSGYAQITAVASSISATATVISPFESTVKSNKWREGGWSEYQGYPKACTTFEQRVFFGGTTRKPTGVWASATDDISNFDFRSTDDGDAFFRVIDNSQNEIQWMSRKDKVFVGTAGEEFFISSSNEQEAITPSNVTVKTSGGNGSAPIKPVSLGSSLAFVTLNKIQLRELAYSTQDASYTSDSDLTELADTITGLGIKQIAFQQYPNRTIYAIREDGVLLGLVWDKKNSISGWFTRETDGEIESVVSTRNGTGIHDPLGIIVKRTIDGTPTRFIETLSVPSSVNNEWVFVDAAVRIESLGSTSVSGQDHLEGKTVRVLNDGALEQNKVVTSGAFELDRVSNDAVVFGLDYEATFTTLPIQVNTGDGNPRGKQKASTHLMLGVRESLGGTYGFKAVDDKGDTVTTADNVFTIDTMDRVMGAALEPITRYYRLAMDGGHFREYSLKISRTDPLPLNVTHAIPAMQANGD